MPQPPSAPSDGDRAEPAPLVRVEGVSKTYRNGGIATPVLRGTSLELSRGETTSLVGVSGSGKSTLISVLAGLMLPDDGRVLFAGQDVGALDEAARATLRAGRIGLV